jgi:serine/threonine-protein kinase RsbW
MVVKADPSGLSVARSLIRGIADELELADEEAADLLVATGEALSNAYGHGGAGQGGFIHVSWDVEDQILTVRVEDDGPGFSPLDTRIDSSDPLRGGCGIPLMRRLIDDVRFVFDDGTRVVLRKSLQRQGQA